MADALMDKWKAQLLKEAGDDPTSFGLALDYLQLGGRVRRQAWGEGAFLYLVPGSKFAVNRPPLLGIFEEGKEIRYMPHIDIFNGEMAAMWSLSQIDILSGDWILLRDADSEVGA